MLSSKASPTRACAGTTDALWTAAMGVVSCFNVLGTQKPLEPHTTLKIFYC